MSHRMVVFAASLLFGSAAVGMGGGCSLRKLGNNGLDGGDGGNDSAADADILTDAGLDTIVDVGADTSPPPSGSILWARSSSSATFRGVEEDSTGVVVVGYLLTPVNLGGSLLTPVGGADVVIAKFATADGAHLFSSRFGGSTPAGTGSVFSSLGVLDSSGAPLVSGVSYCDPGGAPACSKIDLGQGPADPGGGSFADGFIGRYTVDTGAPSWLARLVGPGEDQITSVTHGPNNSIYVAGWFDQNTSLVANSGMRTFIGGGDRDVLIAQLNVDTGQIGMTKTFTGPSFEQPDTIAWTGSNIIVAGTFSGTSVFGARTLNSAGDFDVWVAKLLPADGTPLWAVSLGGLARDVYPHMVVDSIGDIYLAGTVGTLTSFGGYSVGGAGDLDVFVAKLRNIDGSVVWATSFGSTGPDNVAAIAINSSGQLLVSATVGGPIQGAGPGAGSNDAAFVSYNRDGTRLWTKVIGTIRGDSGVGVTNGADSFYAIVSLGADIGTSVEGVSILGPQQTTSLLLKLQP